MRIAIVVPFLNEEGHLPAMLASLAAQSRPPDRVVLLDDGSTDGSRALADAFAREHAWARVVQRPPRELGRDRLAGGAAVRAFAWAVDQLDEPWDVVAKVDADLVLAPELLATLESELARDRALGMVGGFVSLVGEDGVAVRQRCPIEHVEGETKFYRRQCYEEIAPLPLMLGWDSIDEVRARLRGWRTETVEVPGGDTLHLRQMGSHDGVLRGYRRWGACAWGVGDHPLHVIAVAVQRIRDRPAVIGMANYVFGWARAGLRRLPRAEPEVRRAVREDELRRIRARLLRQPRVAPQPAPRSFPHAAIGSRAESD